MAQDLKTFEESDDKAKALANEEEIFLRESEIRVAWPLRDDEKHGKAGNFGERPRSGEDLENGRQGVAGKTKKKRAPTWLSPVGKNLIRETIVVSLCLLLPYFDRIVELSENFAVIIPIYGVILALTPIQQTAVGAQIQRSLVFLITWPFYLCFVLLMIAVSPRKLGSYLVLLSLGILCALVNALTYPTIMLVTILEVITFSVATTRIFQRYNLGDQDGTEFEDSVRILAGATFSIAVPILLYSLGALVIFPWRSINSTRQALQNRYFLHANLLSKLRPVYKVVAKFTMDPRDQTHPLFLLEETLQDLRQARKEEVQSVVNTQGTLLTTLFETRWLCNGLGMEFVNRYLHSVQTSRISRSAADDILNKFEIIRQRISKHGVAVLMEELEEEKQRFQTQEDGAEEEEGRNNELKKRICTILEELSLLLEAGARIMALVARCESRHCCFNELSKIQQSIDPLVKELREVSEKWMGPLLRDAQNEVMMIDSRRNGQFFLRRSALISYILTMCRLADAQKEEFQANMTELREFPWREWTMTFPWPRDLIETVFDHAYRNLYNRFKTKAEIIYRMQKFFASQRWKTALKFAFGTTILVIPGLLENTNEAFATAQLINSVFTFQVILFLIEAGLVLQRTFQRLLGILIGAVLLATLFQIACIGGCKDNHRWILFAFELLLLAGFFWLKTKHPSQGYIGFAVLRTYAVLATSFYGQSSVSQRQIWIDSMFVFVSSAVGAVLALILGLLVWSRSGRRTLRHKLGNAFHAFVGTFEGTLAARYEKPNEAHVEMKDVSSLEHLSARTLFANMEASLRSVKLETTAYTFANYESSSYEFYEDVVDASRIVWRSTWKLHHIGGVRVFLRDQNGIPSVTMSATTAHMFFSLNRWLTTCFSLISFALKSNDRQSMQVLRPLVASPHLLGEVLNDMLVAIYTDTLMIETMLNSSLESMSNMLILRDVLLDISYALERVFIFLERVHLLPKFAETLRNGEKRSFDVFTPTNQ